MKSNGQRNNHFSISIWQDKQLWAKHHQRHSLEHGEQSLGQMMRGDSEGFNFGGDWLNTDGE